MTEFYPHKFRSSSFFKIISISLFVSLSILFLFSCSDGVNKAEIQSPQHETVTVIPNEYGLVVDSLIEFKGKVKKNETLTDILLPFNIYMPHIYEISKAAKGIFDVRKIIPGKDYTVYTENDSVKSARYFVYEFNPLEFAVINLRDTIDVIRGKKKFSTVEKELAGVIDFSLYETMSELNADIMLTLKLSEVFAWQIDFRGIQKGDHFKVIYDEEYINGKFFRIGNIKAAYFNHSGEDFYGFYFRQNEKDEYFDQEGNSLQKQFLKAPLKFSRISSRYSGRRLHPILNYYRPHRGIDYAAPVGTPVSAVGDGIVVEKKYSKSAGYMLKIKHNGTYSSAYLHLSKYASGIRNGKKINQGDLVGYVGSSGLSTGPHLDFRFWKHGSLVNYLRQKFPSSFPVKEENKTEFAKYKNLLLARLSLLPFPIANPELSNR